MVGDAAFHHRIIKRLETLRKTRRLTAREEQRLTDSRLTLRNWCAWQVSGPISTGIIWAPKVDGGPYALQID